MAQELLDIVWVAALAGASMGFGLRIVLETLMKTLIKSLVLLATLLTGTAYALPALQLGPGTGDWTYNTITQTWETTDNTLTVIAYANAPTADGGNGDYAWESATILYAYLIVSAVPNQTTATDVFDVTVSGSTSTITLVDNGLGSPPPNDPNSLAGHSIFDTYYEVYQFAFDVNTLGLIGDTQPGGTGTGQGYMESITIQINSLFEDLEGIHFDLFTVNGNGHWNSDDPNDRKLVYAFAPFSHDAEFVPEPATAALLLLALLGFCFSRHRHNS